MRSVSLETDVRADQPNHLIDRHWCVALALVLMPRRTTTAAVDKYFEDRNVPAATKAGSVVESTCKCCDAPPFLGMTSTRKVAHICGIAGQGIATCSHSKIALSKEQILDVAVTTKSGKDWVQRGASGPSPNVSCQHGDERLITWLIILQGTNE